MHINRIILSAIILAAMPAQADENRHDTADKESANSAVTDKVDYMPAIHGVLRTRWEGEFNDGFAQRFQVRNARLSVAGKVLPSLSYFIQFDACDRGKMKFLDAYARWGFAADWKVQAGQFRVPYGVDCFRGPASYYFSNRSFMGKHVMNMREVGAKIGYYGTKIPLTLEAGMFNSAATSNHDVWQDAMNYAVKGSFRVGDVTFSASYISVKPDIVRINLVDGAVTWQTGRWIVEGEYQHKHYTNRSHKAVDAWNLFTSYAIPLDSHTFNSLSMQTRFDGMTDHSNGTCSSDGKLHVTEPARRRITVGATLSALRKNVKADLRLNYEKYFYDDNITVPKGDNDKIVAELVIKF